MTTTTLEPDDHDRERTPLIEPVCGYTFQRLCLLPAWRPRVPGARRRPRPRPGQLMPQRPMTTCPRHGKKYRTGSKCPVCVQRRATRPGASARGYGADHRNRFRAGVLDKHPNCVICLEDLVFTPTTVADHWPKTRRQLIADGQDPDDPANGRGLCKQHHDQHTARTSPGGWNQSDQ